MSSPVKNVILLGGTSLIGKGFVEYIASIDSPFETVTITTRSPTRPPWLPSTPKYKTANVDFTSHESLVLDMKGQDAVVALLGVEILHLEPAVVDAAIEAGVKILVPNDFGYDTSPQNPKLANLLALPVAFWKTKADNHASLVEKAKAGKIKTISVVNGPIFDWGLGNGLLGFNYAEKKATIYDGGDVPIGSISTSRLGEGVARLLISSSKYIGKTVYLNSLVYTQNAVLRQLETKTSSKWTVEKTTSKGAIEFGKQLAETEPLPAAWAIIAGVVYDTTEAYAPVFGTEDAQMLGLQQENLEEVADRVF